MLIMTKQTREKYNMKNKKIEIGMRWSDVYELMDDENYDGFTKRLEKMYSKEFDTKIRIDWLD
jgi:hypothetical protein